MLLWLAREMYIMARVKQTVKVRRKKTGGKSGYRKCNMCHGRGVIKVKK